MKQKTARPASGVRSTERSKRDTDSTFSIATREVEPKLVASLSLVHTICPRQIGLLDV